MANTDRAYGFVPKGPLLRCNPYTKDVVATGVFIGDVVSAKDDGNVEAATAGDITILGSSLVYSATLTATTAANPLLVSDHTDQLYMAQDDGATTPAQTDLFNIVDHVAGTGSTTTLLSAHELGLGSLGTTNGGFKLLDFVNREDNDATAVNADWICQLNVGEGLLTVAAGV